MRPIKFRYFDGKKMEYEDDSCPSLGSFILVSEMNRKGDLMQFTGLLDKNGNEIWEGDIVSCAKSVLSKGKGEIVFDSSGKYQGAANYCGFKILGYKLEQLTELKASKIEVIGNIYEHPDLLKI